MMEDNVSNENVDEILHDYFTQIKTLQRDMKNRNNEYEIRDYNAWENLIEKAIESIDCVMTEEINFRMIRLIAMRTTLLFERAKMMSLNNDEDKAIELLLQCSNHIMFHCTNLFVVYLAMKILNHYAYLHMGSGKYGEVVEALELAGKIYDRYCDENSRVYFTSEDLFSSTFAMPRKNRDKLAKIVTMNYWMLVYAYSKEKHNKFPECYHNVLDKLYKMQSNDQLKWSANVINLAVHFLAKNRFEEARHHFSAANYVLYEYETKLKGEHQLQRNTEWMKLRWQILNKIYTDLAIGWIKYGIHIFIESRNEILKEINHDTNHSKNLELPSTEVSENVQATYNSEKLFFTTLDVSHLESQVPANLITCITEARILFHHTLAWLGNLTVRLSVKEHPIEYLNAIFDMNKLYALLALYEESLDVKYELTKFRINIIETLRQIVHEFDPQVWTIARPLTLHELTIIQLELMQLHVHRLFVSDGTSSDLNKSGFKGILETISNLQSQLYQVERPSTNMIDPSPIACD